METKATINLVDVFVSLGYNKSTARPSASKIFKMAMITKELPMDCMVSQKELEIVKKYVVEKSTSKYKDAWSKLDVTTVKAGEPNVIVKSAVARINEIVLSFSKWAKEEKIDPDALELLLETCKQELTDAEEEKKA